MPRSRNAATRDAVFEVRDCAYRVYFRDASNATDEWRLTDAAHIDDVRTWAETHAQGRQFELFAEVPTTSGLCLLELKLSR